MMRLSIFIWFAVGVSLAVGLITGLSGAGFWLSLSRGIVVLVVLQIAYFIFLIFTSRRVKQMEPSDYKDLD